MFRHRFFILSVPLIFGSCLLHGQRIDSSSFELSESPKIQQMMREFIESNAAKRTMQGYRVQIANGSKAELLEYKYAVLQQFPDLPVHLLHIYPEYRLQVGDFRDALDAERTLGLIRVHYPGAFTLATEIQWPSLD
ncbi:MAG: hypothetical protein EBT52_06105 [Flavobacteriia bacterium]|nr:hypothetical protein [Flavobacteriia bacterium]